MSEELPLFTVISNQGCSEEQLQEQLMLDVLAAGEKVDIPGPTIITEESTKSSIEELRRLRSFKWMNGNQ